MITSAEKMKTTITANRQMSGRKCLNAFRFERNFVTDLPSDEETSTFISNIIDMTLFQLAQ